MKIYRMQDRPDDVMGFIFRELCGANYPSEAEFACMKAQLKQLLLEKERRTLRESIEQEDILQTDEEIQKILNELFSKFQHSEKATSLLKKHLTAGIFEKLRDLRTIFNGSFLDNIQSGLTVHDQEVGVFASDADAYQVFAELFELIINDLHKVESDEVKQEVDKEIKDLDPEKLFVKSITITCNRSLKEFPFVSIANSKQLTEIAEKIRDVLESIDDNDIEGTFDDYQDIDEDKRKLLQDEGILFSKLNEEYQTAAKSNRLWPHARGIFFNDDKTVRVWVNHQEHLLAMSVEKSGDFKSAYDRMKKLMNYFEDVEFAKNEKYGFLVHNLQLIGVGLEISTEIKIPQLMKEENAEKFDAFVDKKFFDIENLGRGHVRLTTKQRLELSEVKLCGKFQSKIADIITAEKCLYKGDFVMEKSQSNENDANEDDKKEQQEKKVDESMPVVEAIQDNDADNKISDDKTADDSANSGDKTEKESENDENEKVAEKSKVKPSDDQKVNELDDVVSQTSIPPKCILPDASV